MSSDFDFDTEFDLLPVTYQPAPTGETWAERLDRTAAQGRAWRDQPRPGDTPTNDALRQLIKDAGGDPDAYMPYQDTWQTNTDPHTDLDNPLAPYLINWTEFWDAEQDQDEWLLEPLFAKRRAHALYAGAKTGKSYLILAACAALATGRPFLNYPGGEPINVLYVDMEMTMEDLRDRLSEFGYGPDDDLTHLHYALLPSLPPLDTHEGGQELLEAALSVGAQFVIIDTTSRVISGGENDSDTMRAFYRHTGLPLKQNAIGWMRLDHSGKDSTKGQRGSSSKNDDVDVVIRLERTAAGQKLTATHRRMSWFPEITDIEVKDQAGTMRFVTGAASWPEGTKEVADILNQLGAPLDISVNKSIELMRTECGGARKRATMKAAIKYRQQTSALAVTNLDPQTVDNYVTGASATTERGTTSNTHQTASNPIGRGRTRSTTTQQPQGETPDAALGRGRTRSEVVPRPTTASHVVDAAPSAPPQTHPNDDDF
jgi:hypothetical protein